MTKYSSHRDKFGFIFLKFTTILHSKSYNCPNWCETPLQNMRKKIRSREKLNSFLSLINNFTLNLLGCMFDHLPAAGFLSCDLGKKYKCGEVSCRVSGQQCVSCHSEPHRNNSGAERAIHRCGFLNCFSCRLYTTLPVRLCCAASQESWLQSANSLLLFVFPLKIPLHLSTLARGHQPTTRARLGCFRTLTCRVQPDFGLEHGIE